MENLLPNKKALINLTKAFSRTDYSSGSATVHICHQTRHRIPPVTD
ncbi:hypothetical protein [Bombilactobacillus thymidiniphilus]|uniref:Uncharacterized protein n=1 Tax=Bombilactobacillus thymidiniphilus TaxID=2923363 RepID=A0ABY4PEJ5_9LACO|nr:hypothetical protein [Bombilactobacillus thymidiniphilus]UQS84214.1 hypothetical protein MOO47_03425 [Bombilactobacillus thymidiniphilus]